MAKRTPSGQDRQIRALKAESAVYEHAITGCAGLRLRVSPSGRKTFFFRYRNRTSNALEKLNLGAYPGMTLAEARTAAEKQRGVAIEHGSARGFRDAKPREQQRALVEEQAEVELEAFTVAHMLKEYEKAEGKKLVPKTQRDNARYFSRYVIPVIGPMPAAEVRRADIIELFNRVSEDGPFAANRMLSALRRVFNLALLADKVPFNPCSRILRNDEPPKERH